MAVKRQVFDVWVVETNTVYKQVPYTVVTDWVQEGRLLEEDKVRPGGTEAWLRLGDVPAFSAFVPRAEPTRAEDQAEALESVHVDVTWKAPRGEADEDVDMIPLIDISLVLLIFFMMTTTVGGPGSLFDTPTAKHMQVTVNPQMYWVGVRRDREGQLQYSLGLGEGEGEESETFQSKEAVVRALLARLPKEPDAADVRIRADKDLKPCQVVTEDLMGDLDALRQQHKLRNVYFEVSVKEQP